MIAYATLDNLATWLTDAPPANADQLLRSASILIARACMRNPFTDIPTVADTEPLKDATCAQAAFWVALGIDPATSGVAAAGPVKKSTILGGDVERDTTGQNTALMEAASTLAPEARAILTAALLISLELPVSTSPDDPLPQWGQGRRWWPLPEPMSGELDWPFSRMFP